MIKSLKKGLSLMSPQLKAFIIKAISLFTVWMLVYELYLGPKRIFDSFFTDSVTNFSAYLLKIIYPHKNVVSNIIFGLPGISINGVTAITILDGCNGLELLVLYVGFLLCLPAKRGILISFIIGGCIGIYMINIARLVILSCLQINHYAYTSSVHHYVFTIVVYSFIFYLWVLYLKYAFKNKSKAL